MKRKTKPQEGEVVDQPQNSPPPKQVSEGGELATSNMTSLTIGLSTENLKAALKKQTEHRKLIKQFINRHLVNNIDYGKIHVVKGCTSEVNERGSCKNPKHFGKSTLLKPGQEKIFSLFGLTSQLERDVETMEMLSNIGNLVAYVCKVYQGNKFVAEGRGAAVVGDNRRDVNATIKIAEKRARMDACLSLGFSEYFTQDLDDPDYALANDIEKQNARNAQPDQNTMRTDTQRVTIARLFKREGITDTDHQLRTMRVNGIPDPSKMTYKQAQIFISVMLNKTYKKVQGPIEAEIVPAPESVSQATSTQSTAAPDGAAFDPSMLDGVNIGANYPAETIDDAFKAKVQAALGGLGLKEFYLRQFLKDTVDRITTKSLKPSDWLKLRDRIERIRTGDETVPDEWAKGFVENVATPQTLSLDPSEPMRNQPVEKVFPGAQDITNGEPKAKGQPAEEGK